MGTTTFAHREFAKALVSIEPGTQNGGTYAFKKGFHSTRIDNQKHWPGNYSYRDLPNQWGPSTVSAGTDWTFPAAQRGDYARIAHYSSRIYAARNDPRVTGWYEFYGNTDLDTRVEGFCFYTGKDATSDSSHLWHIHFSELRMWASSWLNKAAMLSVVCGMPLSSFIETWDNTSWDLIIEPMRKGARGIAVYLAQRRLGVSPDGVFGKGTEFAVRRFQGTYGLPVDGVIGSTTWNKLLQATTPVVIPHDVTNEGESNMGQLTGPDPWDASTNPNGQAAQLRDGFYLMTTGYQPSQATDNGVIARLERIEQALAAPTVIKLDPDDVDRIATVLINRTDVPLSEGDRAVIISAVKQALREGVV